MKRRSRVQQALYESGLRYANGDGGGRWVTIGEGDGGSRVFIKGGEITKGGGKLKGQKIGDVDQGKDGTPNQSGPGGEKPVREFPKKEPVPSGKPGKFKLVRGKKAKEGTVAKGKDARIKKGEKKPGKFKPLKEGAAGSEGFVPQGQLTKGPEGVATSPRDVKVGQTRESLGQIRDDIEAKVGARVDEAKALIRGKIGQARNKIASRVDSVKQQGLRELRSALESAVDNVLDRLTTGSKEKPESGPKSTFQRELEQTFAKLGSAQLFKDE